MRQNAVIDLPNTLVAPKGRAGCLSDVRGMLNLFIEPARIDFKVVGDLEDEEIGFFFKDFDFECQQFYVCMLSLALYNAMTEDEVIASDRLKTTSQLELVRIHLPVCYATPEASEFEAYVVVLPRPGKRPRAWGNIIVHKPSDTAVFSRLHCPVRLPVLSTSQGTGVLSDSITEASSRKLEYIANRAGEWLVRSYQAWDCWEARSFLEDLAAAQGSDGAAS